MLIIEVYISNKIILEADSSKAKKNVSECFSVLLVPENLHINTVRSLVRLSLC